MDIVECLIRAGQNGYASEITPFVGLCRELWSEEQLWDAIKDYQHAPNLRTRLMYNAKIGNIAKFLVDNPNNAIKMAKMH